MFEHNSNFAPFWEQNNLIDNRKNGNILIIPEGMCLCGLFDGWFIFYQKAKDKVLFKIRSKSSDSDRNSHKWFRFMRWFTFIKL